MKQTGKVSLVGAGPGDPKLITEKGKYCLESCEVVVYDYLVSEELLSLCPSYCKKIYVGKQVGKHSASQNEINQILIKEAKKGKQVVRLKGGDPFVFGRGGEEVLALKNKDIPYQIVPGVTSAIAALTYAGIPITHRGVSRSFHVITGHTADSETSLTDQYEVFAKLDGTLVFLMGLSHIEEITSRLLTNGKPPKTKAAVISNGTLPNQKTVVGTLDNITEKVKEANLSTPAILVFGEVAGISLTDLSHQSLSGYQIGITGTKAFTKKLAMALQDEGAAASVYDYLAIQKTIDPDAWINLKEMLSRYTWIVFTSTNGIRLFFESMKQYEIDSRSLAGIKIAVVGSGTKETLKEYGMFADYMPEVYTTKALGEGLVSKLNREDCLLLPRAKKASADLTNCLHANQVIYHELPLYDTKVNEKKCEAARKKVQTLDYLTFASSSGAEAFLKAGTVDENTFKNGKIVCIGDVTEKTVKSYGFSNVIVAKEYTYQGIVTAIKNDVAKNEDTTTENK